MDSNWQVSLLQQGVEAWNAWRREHPEIRIDLCSQDLSSMDLSGIDLKYADLTDAILQGTILVEADLFCANLYCTDLSSAKLNRANLSNANLVDASLVFTNLEGAVLSLTRFDSCTLRRTDFSNAQLDHTLFIDIDLSGAIKLETVKAKGLSNISIDTIHKSNRQLPEAFLYACGITNEVLELLPEILGVQPVEQARTVGAPTSLSLVSEEILQDYIRRIRIHCEHLHNLSEQKATFGPHTPSHILTQIRKEKEQIKKLKAYLRAHGISLDETFDMCDEAD